MKNSAIVVFFTVAVALVLSFFAALALAKYRFTGRKLFIVLVIGIQMLPPTGLVIPLYVVAGPLSPGEHAQRRHPRLSDLLPAVLHMDAARLPDRHPEGARGGGDG